jgi:site-specific recombinase XerD
MSTINFYLKKATLRDESTIMMTYLFRSQKFRYSTELKVSPSGWKNQRVRPNISGCAEINGILDQLTNHLKEIEREALFNKQELTLEQVKDKFLTKIGAIKIKRDFFSVYDHFIEKSKATKAANTIKAYQGTKRKLLKFAKDKSIEITFKSVNQMFYESFVNYLINDLGMLNNSVGKHIKTLKVFLRYAIEFDFVKEICNLRKFKVFSEDSDIIYLTETELLNLFKLENLADRLKNVRDTFCFACFTGLRFSDIAKLTRSNIKNDFLEIKTQKTKDFIKIPLNDFAKTILLRHKNNSSLKPLPTDISNQKTNEYLKELGEFAQITELVTIEKYAGSKKIIISKPKFNFLSTHTARRTFVTLSLEKGIRAEVVMAMTGHKSYRTFKKYIKITDKVMQSEMQRVWNTPLLKVV